MPSLVGSEMCIRDSRRTDQPTNQPTDRSTNQPTLPTCLPTNQPGGIWRPDPFHRFDAGSLAIPGSSRADVAPGFNAKHQQRVVHPESRFPRCCCCCVSYIYRGLQQEHIPPHLNIIVPGVTSRYHQPPTHSQLLTIFSYNDDALTIISRDVDNRRF